MTTSQNDVHVDSKPECPGGDFYKCNEICNTPYKPYKGEFCFHSCQQMCPQKLGTGKSNYKNQI